MRTEGSSGVLSSLLFHSAVFFAKSSPPPRLLSALRLIIEGAVHSADGAAEALWWDQGAWPSARVGIEAPRDWLPAKHFPSPTPPE